MDRRSLLIGGAAAGSAVLSGRWSVANDAKPTNEPWLRKTLKQNMVRLPGNNPTDLTDLGAFGERCRAAKSSGFDGYELSVPLGGGDSNISAAELARVASDEGIVLDGTVGGYHWKIRHTDPDEGIRADAGQRLKQGIRQTMELGGDTMLLVPGHGKDGDAKTVYDHATRAIEKALPHAEEHKVHIVVENVWNHFLYDHEGGSDQTADQHLAFVKQFDSRWVGMQFDIGNHWKYGNPADWIKTLDRYIFKLDIKGFSREKSGFTDVTVGELPWNEFYLALR
ncbi:MAG: sugar phosphate isomerase/epimerase family protein [Planctomycetota bacterium]